MKKLLLYSLLSLALFSGCEKQDNLIDDQKPEERVTAALTAYENTLTSSPNGWKAYLYTDGGAGYSFFVKFDNQNRVKMYADINATSATTIYESSYRLKGNQLPSLLFDTYSYIHLLADPNPGTIGGAAGFGKYSDFEFSFDKIAGDTIKMTGKFMGSKMLLIKAKATEETAYNAGSLNTLINAVNAYTTTNKNLYVLLGDATKIQTTLNPSSKVFSLTWEAGGEVSTVSSPYAYTLTGIVLQNPVVYKTKKIYELTWDAAANVLYAMVDGSKVIVQISPTPILPLHLLIGVSYSSINVPNGTTGAGWSSDYVTRRAAANAATLAGGYLLRLDKMVYKFNTFAQTMVLTIDIYQNATKFTADFPYTYTKTPAGVYKFTAQAVSGNASLIIANMGPLLGQRLNVDTFTLDYFVDPTLGTLGQFKSVENPGYTFAGTLL